MQSVGGILVPGSRGGQVPSQEGSSPGKHGFLQKQEVRVTLPPLSQNVGLTLRKLIGSVDDLLPSLPSSSRTEVGVLLPHSVIRCHFCPSPSPAPAVLHSAEAEGPHRQPYVCLRASRSWLCMTNLSGTPGGLRWCPGTPPASWWGGLPM